MGQIQSLKLSGDVANKHFKSWETAAQKASTALKEVGDLAHWTAKLELELDVVETALELARDSQTS